MTIFGLGVFVYVLVIISRQAVAGLSILASIISLFSGAQLFALGIFGEYLARMFDRSMDRLLMSFMDGGKVTLSSCSLPTFPGGLF